MDIEGPREDLFVLTNGDGQVYVAAYDTDGVCYELVPESKLADAVALIRKEYEDGGGVGSELPINVYQVSFRLDLTQRLVDEVYYVEPDAHTDYEGYIPLDNWGAPPNRGEAEVSSFQGGSELQLGNHSLTVRALPYGKSGFSHKVVFEGLRELLAARGLSLGSVETCENGQGSELAMRVRLDKNDPIDLVAPISLEIIPHPTRSNGQYSHLIILNRVEEAFAVAGVTVTSSATRVSGRGSPMGIRVSLTEENG